MTTVSADESSDDALKRKNAEEFSDCEPELQSIVCPSPEVDTLPADELSDDEPTRKNVK